MEFLLEGAKSHHTPKHFTDFSTGRQVSPAAMLDAMGCLLDESKAHFSGQRQKPLDLVKESIVATCSVVSIKLVALERMSSAWAKAPRKRSFTLRARCLCLNLHSRGSITRLKRVGNRTDLWRMPRLMLKGFDNVLPSLT